MGILLSYVNPRVRSLAGADDSFVLREWLSEHGLLRKVVATKDGLLVVQTEGSTFMELMEPSWLERQVQIDTSNLASRKRAEAVVAADREAERKKLEAKRDTSGFTDGMPAIKARKVEEILDKQAGFNGEVMKRRQFIERAVAAGGYVEIRLDGTRLFYKDSEGRGYFTEKDLTKTGMDYAEHLVRLKGR